VQISFSKSAIQEWRRLSTKKDSLFHLFSFDWSQKGSPASVYLGNAADARDAQDQAGTNLMKEFS
jgi:hypothetical protein